MPASMPAQRLLAALALGCCSVGADAHAQSPPAGFAVVELFTSEGCSSCPPADRLLVELDAWATKNEMPVYALSFHVDYWDRLGWADPFGSPEFSERQRAYAAASDQRSVYTPQMIVNGKRSFVGSNSKQATAALGEALAAESLAAVTIQSAPGAGGAIEVRYRTTDAPAGSVLNVALVQPTGSQDVSHGENAGRQLTHVNIVRAFRQVSIGSAGTGGLMLARPAGFDGPLETIAYLQQTKTGRVLAAASASAP